MELGKESLAAYFELQRKQRSLVNGGLPEEKCAQIMKGIFKALVYIHDKCNVIHRDIKPDNIILGSHKDLSAVKLIDFGLAVNNSHRDITDFAKCGTFLYKPPEQVSNSFAYAIVSTTCFITAILVRIVELCLLIVESGCVGCRRDNVPASNRQTPFVERGHEQGLVGRSSEHIHRIRLPSVHVLPSTAPHSPFVSTKCQRKIQG